MVRPCIDVMPRWMTANLKPIDESKLLYLDEQFDSIRASAPAFHDGQRFFVSLYWGFTSFIYRTDMTDITPEEESWSLLFDERFKGRIAIWDSTDCVIPHTSLALGHSDDPYRPDGERLDQVADMMRKQRNLVRLYYPDVTTGVQAIASGEVVISYAWSEFLQPLRGRGHSVPLGEAQGRVDQLQLRPRPQGWQRQRRGAIRFRQCVDVGGCRQVPDRGVQPRCR